MSAFKDPIPHKDYGIIINRPWYVSLLVNLPLINLLYTKKYRIDVTFMTAKAPVIGVFRNIRLFRWSKEVNTKYKILGDGRDWVEIEKNLRSAFATMYRISPFTGESVGSQRILNNQDLYNKGAPKFNVWSNVILRYRNHD